MENEMEPQNPVGVDASQLAIVQQKLALDNRIRSGIGWFYWIAGFSLVNTVIHMFGSNLTFVVGLGVTQIIDVFAAALAQQLGQGGFAVIYLGLGLDVGFAGLFVAMGVLGRKRKRWAVIVGIVLYAIDAIILLLFQDFLSVAFHGLALFGIAGGLKSIRDLEALEKAGGGESIDSLRQRLPPQQSFSQPIPVVTPQQKRTRMILIGVILLVFFACFVAISLQAR
jgi:hypothetical protein